jgi:hypothetical protein
MTRFGLHREEVPARSHTVETDNPFGLGALGANGVVVQTEHLLHFIEELWLLTSCCVRQMRFLI